MKLIVNIYHEKNPIIPVHIFSVDGDYCKLIKYSPDYLAFSPVIRNSNKTEDLKIYLYDIAFNYTGSSKEEAKAYVNDMENSSLEKVVNKFKEAKNHRIQKANYIIEVIEL